MEDEVRVRRKKGNIQRTVLAAVAVTGTLAIAMLAPNIFLALISEFRKKFIPLSNIGLIRFGVKSGANPWFYFKYFT